MENPEQLSQLLALQAAGEAPLTREQVEQWHELYPYFSFPLLQYLATTHDTDPALRARASAYVGDLEHLATLVGAIDDYSDIYPPQQSTAVENTTDAIDLFLQTYSHEADDEENPIIELLAGDTPKASTEERPAHKPQRPVVPIIPAYDYTGMMQDMPDAPDAVPMENDDLLTRFIEAEESGERMFLKQDTPDTPATPVPQAPVEAAASDEHEPLFTESLARIYIGQRKYDRALEIIKKLSLNNPEKNIYFADQIRFLEKLIINIKN